MNAVEEQGPQGSNPTERRQGDFERQLPKVSDGGKSMSPNLFPLSLRQEKDAVAVDRCVCSTVVSSGKTRSPSSAVDYRNHVRPFFHDYVAMKNMKIVTMVSLTIKFSAVSTEKKMYTCCSLSIF